MFQKTKNILNRVWYTLQIPRIVTFVMLISYAVTVWIGIQSLLNYPPPIDPIMIMSSGFIIAGGIIAFVSCWVGSFLKFLEGPACLSIFFGMILSIVLRATTIPDIERVPISLPFAILAGLFFVTRMLRIWSDFDDPTEDEINKYQVKTALMKEEYHSNNPNAD